MKATCKTNPTHKHFITVVHVTEDWVVDENGNFVDLEQHSDTQVVHGPNPGNTWTCVSCGEEATVEA